MPEATYKISADGSAIMCLCCNGISHHPMDVKNRYCGWCHQYHPIMPTEPAAAGTASASKPIRWWVCRNPDAEPTVAADSQFRIKPIPGMYMLIASHDRPKMYSGFWTCQPKLSTDIRLHLGPAPIAEAALPFNLRPGMCREVDIKLTPIPRPSSNR